MQSKACAISTGGKVACWGQVEYDDDSVAVDRRAGMSTPHVLVGVDGVIDVVHEWFYVCVAQKPEAGTGGCFVTNKIDRKPPVFPSPPVSLDARPMSESGICAVMRDGHAGCVSLEGTYVEAPNVRDAVSLTCDSDACCAITKTGAAQCWGGKPPKLPTLPPITALAWHYDGGCARTKAGAAQCWGDDEAKALSQPTGVRDIGVYDGGRLCIVRDDGTVHCENDESRPVTAKNVAQIDYSCVRYSDGSVGCTGFNEHGELGDGGVQLSAVPVQVPGLSDVVDLNVAHTNVCAVTKDKSLWCWGPQPPQKIDTIDGTLFSAQYIAGCETSSSSIRCHVPSYSDEWEREYIPRPKDMKGIKTAAMHRDSSICVVSDTGSVQCRHGMSEGGVVDKWLALPAPAPVEQLEPVAVGFCARHTDGRVSCFVDHRYDNDDDFLEKLPTGKLTLMPNVKDATTIAAGQGTVCMINKATEVWCFDSDSPKSKPRQMPTLTGATSLGANHLHTCAVKSGDVWCWGENFLGELGIGRGDGRITPVTEPVPVKASFKAVQVGTGRESSCALDDQGKVWCWGSNANGQLGQPRKHRSEDFSKVVRIGPP